MEYLQGTLVIDRRGDIRMCSGPLAQRVGRCAHELAGEPVWTLLPGWTPFGEPRAESSLCLLAGHGTATVRVSWEPVHLPGETLFVIEVRGLPEAPAPSALAAAAELSPDAVMITDRRGVIRHVNAAFEAMTGYSRIELEGRGISERVRELERLRHAATHDGLTGLANQGLFLDRLEQALRRAARRDEAFALAVADVDRFKDINDRFGHQAGDAVLRATAGRLRACVRDADTVARIGGDEFGLILGGAGTREAAARALEKVLACASAAVTLSVGACLFPGDGDASEALLGHADSAMYRAKRAGGNAFRFHRQLLAAVRERACADA